MSKARFALASSAGRPRSGMGAHGTKRRRPMANEVDENESEDELARNDRRGSVPSEEEQEERRPIPSVAL